MGGVGVPWGRGIPPWPTDLWLPPLTTSHPHPTMLQKEYLDRLWFEKAEGTFYVDLRAILPRHRLACPAALQLPLCAVGDTAEAWFSLDNVG